MVVQPYTEPPTELAEVQERFILHAYINIFQILLSYWAFPMISAQKVAGFAGVQLPCRCFALLNGGYLIVRTFF